LSSEGLSREETSTSASGKSLASFGFLMTAVCWFEASYYLIESAAVSLWSFIIEDTSTSDLSSSKPVPYTDSCLMSMICWISGGFYVTAKDSDSYEESWSDFGVLEFDFKEAFKSVGYYLGSSGSGTSEEASTIFSWA
jgi:hypothetical protein